MLIKRKQKTKTFEPKKKMRASSPYQVKNVRAKLKNQNTLANQLLFKTFDKNETVTSGYIKGSVNPLRCQKTPLFCWVLNNFAVPSGQTKKTPLEAFSSTKKKPFLKTNKKRLQLRIILKSYKNSPKRVADIHRSLDIIAKLMTYLNYFCTKGFKNRAYSIKENYLETSSLARAHYNELFGAYSTENRKTNSVFCLQKHKEGNYLFSALISNLQSKDGGQGLTVLQKNNYSNRYFFKWCELFATSSSIPKHHSKPLHSTQLFTVIRSPFVFKKTREQFSSQKLAYCILVKFENPMQKLFLIQSLGLVRLPCELNILDY